MTVRGGLFRSDNEVDTFALWQNARATTGIALESALSDFAAACINQDVRHATLAVADVAAGSSSFGSVQVACAA